ncbi:Glu/Leu/Phe/Val dehydrogenase dimerization domain-containing protein [Leucobacter albus]|uniref:Glu/Leu/Phe/Val dehydrogenase dimerization domain-containing protein n=1 Tax=Leucobacter albus TaxID=272210 RepID=A0ABW3TT62_9MICO
MTPAPTLSERPTVFPLFDHEQVNISTGKRSGLTIIVAVHSTKLGPALGGCRVWSYDSWGEAAADALRLSRGMTSKNALAGLPLGGGKSVIVLAPGQQLTGELRRQAFLDLGDAVEALGGSYLTAEDVGTTAADMAVVAELTAHAVGLPADQGGLGDPGEYTARGVYSALRETLRRTHGTAETAGRKITIVGLGQVGSALATRLAGEGAELTLSDINDAKQELARELGAAWVSPADAHRVPADVFMPAGVGGMLSPRVIDELDTRAVVGPANNQLAEADGAEQLAARGILYAPDYLLNAGGVIYLGAEGDTIDERIARIDAIGETLGSVFDEAERSGVTTVAAADTLVNALLAK